MKVSLQNLDISDVLPTSAGPAVTRVTWGPGEAGAWQPRYTDIWQWASISGIITQSFFWQLTLEIVPINVRHCIKMLILPFHHFVKITSEQLIAVTSYIWLVWLCLLSHVFALRRPTHNWVDLTLTQGTCWPLISLWLESRDQHQPMRDKEKH